MAAQADRVMAAPRPPLSIPFAFALGMLAELLLWTVIGPSWVHHPDRNDRLTAARELVRECRDLFQLAPTDHRNVPIAYEMSPAIR